MSACNEAYAAGVLLIAAAGNEDSYGVLYPAAYDSVIAVSATDEGNIIAGFSSFGPEVELAAPGVDILSTYKYGGYAIGSGTSMACPHVAGVAALLLAGPGGNVRNILQNTAYDLGDPGWDQWYGYGLVNAAAAVEASADTPPTVSINLPADGATVSGEFVAITASAADDAGVAQVDFYYDSVPLETDYASPYKVVWDSTTVIDGSYTITAVATDTIGQTASDSISVIVDNFNDPPIADAGPDQTTAVGQTVNFDGSFSYDPDGNIVNYNWDFGDGHSETGVSVSYAYSATGTYTVTLTVTDNAGFTSQDTAVITVTEAAPEVEVFYDGFESWIDWNANWHQDFQNRWSRRFTQRKEGSYAAEVDGRVADAQLISVPIGLRGKENAAITFWWYIESGLDWGEYLAFDVSADDGEWVEMAALRGNIDPENTWHFVEVELTDINSIEIRFRGTMSSSRENAYVDEVKVVAWQKIYTAID